MPTAQSDRFVHDRMPPAEFWPVFRREGPELQALASGPVNLVEHLFARARTQGWSERILLRSSRRTWTYAQAQTEVERRASALVEDLGLVPGQRVLLRGGNSAAMALAWLAVVHAGGIAVATMPLLRARELSTIVERSRPALALCDPRLLDELLAALAEQPEPFRIVPFNTESGRPETFETLAQRHPAGRCACATDGDDIALLAFTSGTTGAPKAALHSHRDVASACETWPRHVLRARPDDIVVGTPPLAFTFGLGGLLVFPMWAGASVFFPDAGYTPESLVRTIQAQEATICYTAPTFYRQMTPLARSLGVPTLRISVSAGEGLPDATRQQWKEATGLEMLDGIGATEMFHIFISSAGDAVRRGAIGQVVPGYEARIVDEHGREVPRGTVGKLAVIGPTGCRYLDDARQSNYVRDGWNHPGDAFLQDADGYFFYQARADDMIITAGYNVGGPEVEDALLRHPAVAECGVVGVPDEERGMIVKAFCVLKPGHATDEAMVRTLQEHVKSTIAPYKYPRQIVFVQALPRTETGKLQRFRLRQDGGTP